MRVSVSTSARNTGRQGEGVEESTVRVWQEHASFDCMCISCLSFFHLLHYLTAWRLHQAFILLLLPLTLLITRKHVPVSLSSRGMSIFCHRHQCSFKSPCSRVIVRRHEWEWAWWAGEREREMKTVKCHRNKNGLCSCDIFICVSRGTIYWMAVSWGGHSMPIRLSSKVEEKVAPTMSYHSFPLVSFSFSPNYARVVSSRHGCRRWV